MNIATSPRRSRWTRSRAARAVWHCGPILVSLLVLLALPAFADDVVLDMRLRPATNRVTSMETEAQQTLTVVNDAGMVARLQAMGRPLPFSFSMIQRQVVEHETSARDADGQFTARMRILRKTTVVRDLSGNEREVPEKSNLVGVESRVTIDADGKFVPQSLQVIGAAHDDAKLLRGVLFAMFSQLQGKDAVIFRSGAPATQRATLSLPIENLAVIEMDLNTVYSLRRVQAGIAEIGTSTSMSLRQASRVAPVKAHGFGSGSMSYDVENQHVQTHRSSTIMTFDVELPDGVLRMRTTMRQLVESKDQRR